MAPFHDLRRAAKMLRQRAPSILSTAASRATRVRRLSAAAAPEAAAAYRSHAEDRLLDHLAKVAASALSKGELDASSELYEHLVDARRQRHGDRHPLTVHAIGALSTVAAQRGDYSVAEDLAREAAAASQETLGAMHPDSLRQLSHLAAALTAQSSKLDEAETTARVVFDGYRVVFGEAHADTAQAARNLNEVVDARTQQQQQTG
jgi:hypothetical protein